MRSLRIATITAAEVEFLSTGRNEWLIETACGAGSKNRDNAALWDAVSVTHGTPCRTFSEAFAACCVGRTMLGERRSVVNGRERILRASRIERTWSDFDLRTLRECVPGLDLPSWVYEQQASAAMAEWDRGLALLADGYRDEAQEAYYAEENSVDEEMIESEATALRIPALPAWAWRAA